MLFFLSIFCGVISSTAAFYSLKAVWGFSWNEFGKAVNIHILRNSLPEITPSSPVPSEEDPDSSLLLQEYIERIAREAATVMSMHRTGRKYRQDSYQIITKEDSLFFAGKIYLN